MLTPKGEATRARIIAGAAQDIREQGVDVILDDVMASTRTSKSQLFHYFPGGKEELLVAVAEHEAARVLDDQRPHLDRLDDWTSWTAWRDAVVARYRRQGRSCPLAVLMGEVGRSPAARTIITTLIADWQSRLAAGIRTMQAAGEIAADLDADDAGRALVAGIQGGVSIMLTTGSTDYLEAALDAGIGELRRSVS